VKDAVPALSPMDNGIKPKAVLTHENQQPAIQKNLPERHIHRRPTRMKYKDCGFYFDQSFFIHEDPS